ncbi:hypothetical protein Ocin01_04086, partial [Orchesella cincta]
LVVLQKEADGNMLEPERDPITRRRFNESYPFGSVPASMIPGPPTYDGYVCSTKGSVVGAIFTVLLLQVGLLLSFWYFYRSKQRHWSKLGGIQDSPHQHHNLHSHSPSHHTTSSSSFTTSPEVIFRSVYDRLSAGGRRPILIPYPNSQSSSAHPGVDE